MNLYFLSGLGADKRVFQKLVLPEQYVVHHVEWLTPDADESLQGYAARLLSLSNTADRILPYHENMQAIKVIGAGHLMVYSHAAVLSTLLAENLRMR